MQSIPIEDLEAASEVLLEPFYARGTVEVARDLLGKLLIHGETAGMIVETEAYLGMDDLAAHASRGVTDRTKVIFGPPGRAYVYFIYGMYDCLNLVAEREGMPGCVLIRAVKPLAGLDLMWQRRPAARKPEHLANGPGKLAIALGITRSHNGTDVTSGPITVRQWEHTPAFQIRATPRIGITRCMDWPLRFLLAPA